MNALTTTTTFCPSSFQLKLALNGRKPPMVIMPTRFPELDRRRLRYTLVVRSRAFNGNGLEQQRHRSGKSTWMITKLSADNFSGWSNADEERQSDDSNSKKSLVGILGAAAAGIVLVAGITFAALSISHRSTSKVQKEMEPLTTQQEKSLSSDDHQVQDEEDKSEEKPKLESGSEESKTGTAEDLSLDNDNIEANGDRINDDSGERQLPKDGDDSSVTDSSVLLEARDKPPISDVSDGFLAVPNIKSNNGIIASEIRTEPEAENLANGKFLYPSASEFNDNSETLIAKSGGASDLNEMVISNLSMDSSIVETSNKNISLESDAVSESIIIPEQSIQAGSLLPTEDGSPSKGIPTMHVNPSKSVGVFVDGENISTEGQDLVGTAAEISLPVPEVLYQSTTDQHENDYNETDVSRSIFDARNHGKIFTSAGIPAPSVVSAALHAPPGKVLVPAAVDQLQSQALSALQVLKVIEENVQPGDLCTRREYARWLVLASSVLSRNTISKVYPAMYIENISELAFDDITPDDPDFQSIQGLAEAGLIASKLSRRDLESSLDEDSSPFFFSPDSPLSRQDLVSWKMALEKRQLPVVDRKTLQQLSGFIDIDKIDPDAWPALVADLALGEQGIMTLAFGYTRLFQPEKPVTKAQAAIALSTGDASAMVSEELARIEAESMAEKAVAAHSALVSEVEKDLNANYEKELLLEKEKIDAIEKLAEEARREVEKLRAEREEENLLLMKERAAVDSEMEVLSRLRREVEEQLRTFTADKLEISYEKERMNKLRRDAETENQEIARLQYELEVERKALSIARSWAEDEAKRAREQAKALEEARDRWERQGIKVVVDDDLREEAEAGVTWDAAGKEFSVEETVERSENLLGRLKVMAGEVRGKCKDTINKLIEKIVFLISNLKEKAGQLKDAAKLRLDNSLRGVQQSSAEFTVVAKDSVKRVAGDWKEGVERLSQKFKT